MKIIIVGIGALGSNLASNLIADIANDKKHGFTVLDYQDVEARNIQAYTQEYLHEQIGMSKLKALRINLYQRYKVAVNNIDSKITSIDMSNMTINIAILKNFDLIIDCLDNYEGRKWLTDFAKEYGVECIHLGFSPQMTYQIAWNEGYEPQEGNDKIDICELPGAASFVRLVAGLGASVIIEYFKDKKKIGLIGNRFSIQRL